MTKPESSTKLNLDSDNRRNRKCYDVRLLTASISPRQRNRKTLQGKMILTSLRQLKHHEARRRRNQPTRDSGIDDIVQNDEDVKSAFDHEIEDTTR